jgi:hypothetical protein
VKQRENFLLPVKERMVISKEVEEYLRMRDEVISRHSINQSAFAKDDMNFYEKHTFESEDHRSFYLKEIYYLRSIYCSQYYEYAHQYQVAPLRNDMHFKESFVYSSIPALLTGFNFFHDHDSTIQDVLHYLCSQVRLRTEVMQDLDVMDAVDAVLRIKKLEMCLPVYEKHKDKLDALYEDVRTDAYVLFMHAMIACINICPHLEEDEKHANALGRLIEDVSKAIISMRDLLLLDAGGKLAVLLVHRLHDCKNTDDFEEYAASCRFLLQFLTESSEHIIPWCSLEEDAPYIMTALESALRYLDVKDTPFSILSMAELTLHIYVHFRWLKLVGHFLIPFLLEDHDMDTKLISLLLDTCNRHPRAKVGLFILFRLCYSKVGVLPVLQTLLEDEITPTSLMIATNDLFTLADQACVIFSPFSPIGLMPEYQGFHRVISKMTPEERKHVTFGELMHILESYFLMYQIHGRFLKRTNKLNKVFDLSLDQLEDVLVTNGEDEQTRVMATYDDDYVQGAGQEDQAQYGQQSDTEQVDSPRKMDTFMEDQAQYGQASDTEQEDRSHESDQDTYARDISGFKQII